MILGAFDIKYLLRVTIKGQMLVDSVAEFTEHPDRPIAEIDESMGVQIITVTIFGQLVWNLYVEGSANQKGSDIGIILIP